MEFRVHKKLQDNIRVEQKDIALITAPGMGLSTLLQGISNNQNLVVFIEPGFIQELWNNEFKARSYNNRFVIHAAAVNALLENNIYQAEVDIKRTNLKKFLTEYKPSVPVEKIYILIDDFDELDNDLEKVILDELKAISDQKENKEEYYVFNSLRFVIGGCIDFQGLYSEKDSGISPATNFCKHYPDDFLLSRREIDEFLKANYPEILKSQFALPLIFEWTNGYLYYVEHLAKWILAQFGDDPLLNFESLVSRFQDVIEENKQVPLLKYCHKSWEQIKLDDECKKILQKSIKSPFVRESSLQVKTLMKNGLLLQVQKNIYKTPNHIVMMYLRQRLAELNLVLPIHESPIWSLAEYNSKAYSLLFEIENVMRNYIGDTLLEKAEKSSNKWKDYLNIEFDGKNIRKEAEVRCQKDVESTSSVSNGSDPILGFLDFPDLAYIINFYVHDFPCEFAEKAPEFLKELNYHRRRIAHNRPMTLELITDIEATWKRIKNMMPKTV